MTRTFSTRTISLFKSLTILILLLTIPGCDAGLDPDRGKVGTLTPDFSVIDIDGNAFATESLKGSILVLNFWFISCPPCLREIPELNNLVEKYREKEVVFIAFARDSKSDLKKFLEAKDFDYNIIAKSKRMTKTFNTHGFPTNMIIDQNGKIVFHKAAYDKDRVSEMDKILSTLLDNS